MQRRSNTVVLLGPLGLCCLYGTGDERLLDEAGAPRFTAPPLAQFASRRVGLVPPFDAERYVRQRKSLKLMSRASVLAVAAAQEVFRALEHNPPREEVGLFLAVGMSGGEISSLAGLLEESLTEEGQLDLGAMGERGLGRVNPLLSFHVLNHMPLCHVSIELGLGGPHGAFYASGGAEGLRAIARGAAAVLSGEASFALVGGADAPVDSINLALAREGAFPPAEGAALWGMRASAHPQKDDIVWLGVSEHRSWNALEAARQISKETPDLWISVGVGESPPGNVLQAEEVMGDARAASGALAVALAYARLRRKEARLVGIICQDARGSTVALLGRCL